MIWCRAKRIIGSKYGPQIFCPYPLLACCGRLEVLALVGYMVYVRCIRIPDCGPILKANGLDCRAESVPQLCGYAISLVFECLLQLGRNLLARDPSGELQPGMRFVLGGLGGFEEEMPA